MLTRDWHAFSKTTLLHVTLRETNLKHINLEKAYFEHTGEHNSEAPLSGECTWNIPFSWNANREGASLCEADLRDADLRGAHLEGADLRDTKGLTQEQPV